MSISKFFRKKPDHLANFAKLAEESGDISSSLTMAMSGMDNTQRVDIALKLAQLLPPQAQMSLFGNVVARPNDNLWQQTMDTLNIRDRRTLTVNALKAESQQTFSVDLGQLVVGTQAIIELGHTQGHRTPFPDFVQHSRPGGFGLTPGGALHLESRGGNEFTTLRPFELPIPDKGERRLYPENSVILLQSTHTRREASSIVRFGDQLRIAQLEADQLDTCEIHDWQTVSNMKSFRADEMRSPVKVKGIELDNTLMFY